MPTPTELARRVMQRCDTLALCTDEPGRVTRLFLSPAMRQRTPQ